MLSLSIIVKSLSSAFGCFHSGKPRTTLFIIIYNHLALHTQDLIGYYHNAVIGLLYTIYTLLMVTGRDVI